MWIKSWINKLGISSLSLVIIGYVCVSLFVAFMSYLILESSLFSLTSKIVNHSKAYETEMINLSQDVQKFIIKENLTLDEAQKLEKWHQKHPDLLVYIYQDNEVYYDSSYAAYYMPEEVMYISRTYKLQFADGTAFLDFYPIFNLSFLLSGKALCVMASMVVFMITLMAFLHRQMNYILEISRAVEKMKNGQLSTQIEVKGNHEISQLASDINQMATALEKQIEVEKELRQENIQMVRSLSHDLRTPLTSVISYLDIIKQLKGGKETEKFLDIVYDKALQINYLINQLFHQCVEETKISKSYTEDGYELIEQCLHEVIQSLGAEDFRVLVSVDLEESFSLKFERHDFYRIINNICSNLMKYADDSYEVEFNVIQLEDRLVITVKNKIKPVLCESVESYGVGLLSCQRLIDNIGGTLQTYEEQGFFIFNCELPILQKC